MQEYQDFTNGSTYSGSPSYISDDDGKFGFTREAGAGRGAGVVGGVEGGLGAGAERNAGGGQLKDFPLNVPLPNSRHHRPQACRFCQNNGEEEAFCRTHCTKDEFGLAACPILRKYVCPLCSATGDFAHTIKYCPTNKDGRYNTKASLVDLKKRRNASGKLGNLRSAGFGFAEVNNGMGRGGLAEGMSSSVGSGLVGGMSPSAGHWLNGGIANFPLGFDDVMGFQNGVLLKDEMMRNQLQQKTFELEQLKNQLANHLNNKGCADPGGIMRMAAQAGARHFARGRVEVPTPMDGHLRNARADRHVGGSRPGGDIGGARRGGDIGGGKQSWVGASRGGGMGGGRRVDERDQVTDLGDQLAELREGSVPHREGSRLNPL